MKKFQKWMGILLVGFAASSLFVACGDEEEATCLVDSDCYDEELCNQDTGFCALNCTDDAGVCAGDEVCAPRGTEAGSICVFEGGTTPECTIDADCTGEGETCSDAGVCVGGTTPECTTAEDCPIEGDVCVNEVCESPAAPYFFAELLDTTTDEGACASTNPGSDIFGIMLTKAADNSVAYGRAVNGESKDRSGGEINERGDFDFVLDGTAPSLNDVCPESFDATFSMGCGGVVLVEFLDENGGLVEIETGDLITPMEWGGTCPTGDDLDTWKVSVCDNTVSRNTLEGDYTACQGISQGEGLGISDVTVSL